MKKYESNDNCSYALGTSLTVELLMHQGRHAKEVYLSKKAVENEQLHLLRRLCKENDVPIIVDDAVINKLSVKENCFAVGIFDKYQNELESRRHIVLYGFDDYGELGTIMRSAVCFDFKDLVLVSCNIDCFDPRTIRSSMGGFFHLNIKQYSDLSAYINDYQDYALYPIVKNKGSKLTDITFSEPYALVIPQRIYDLDEMAGGIVIEHKKDMFDMSLSALSSILFNYCYHQNAIDKNI